MRGELHVHFLPVLAPPQQLAGATAIVIDVLRASSTIVTALAAGAEAVVPCLEIDEARGLANSLQPAGNALLGGERGGKKIAGFDLGNSPFEYTPDVVQGRTIVFTTTNGTCAMQACRAARQILIGAFVNLSAVCEAAAQEERVSLLCAGTDGRITSEDILFAGAAVDRLRGGDTRLNDEAILAQLAWQRIAHAKDPSALATALRESRGGRNLVEIGQAEDVGFCAQVDRFAIVPRLDLSSWRIGVNAPPGEERRRS